MTKVYTFTNCGATGKRGPDQSQVDAEYVDSNLQGDVTVTGYGVQEWMVPATCNYRIITYGAQGGHNGYSTDGAYGAKIQGDFNLQAGDILQIVVGQKGETSSVYSAPGGGGTFVVKKGDAQPLIVAGGGGGCGNSGDRKGVAGTTNIDATGDSGGYGNHVNNSRGKLCGHNGEGGTTGDTGYSTTNGGGGGGGWYSDGTPKLSNSGNPGLGWNNGLLGGNSRDNNSSGGFGGGGGNHESSGGGGAGGGYSGGAGGTSRSSYFGGGGGGSYNAGTNQINVSNDNAGHGLATIEMLNNSPGIPSSLNPKGTNTSPAIIATLRPTLSWTFTDSDLEDAQAKYQVNIYKASDNSLIKDTGEMSSSIASHKVQAEILQSNTKYYWQIKVWDNNGLDSPFSTSQYFQTTQVPTTIPISPLGISENPKGTNETPRLEWHYDDPESHTQAYSQIVIKDKSNNVVHDTGKISNINPYYDVPDAALTPGETYSWAVTVWDSSDMSSTETTEQYFITNMPPEKPSNPSPIDNHRVPLKPTLEFTAPIDAENENIHFKLELAADDVFTNSTVKDSSIDATGWEYYNGTTWEPLSSAGLAAEDYGKKIRYRFQEDLVEGDTYYWHVAGYNLNIGAPGEYSDSQRIRVGNSIVYIDEPQTTTAKSERILGKVFLNLATDGILPASWMLEVCNNGFDENPTWEDMTQAAKDGAYHVFTNDTKTATEWAVNYKLTVQANDTMGPVEVQAVSISFD
ncbi:glycine-rich protein [Wukongibacter baidiensis]|uniref:glycoside hydrolase family 78 protein n=1 Tax=Wukongibacter baidiensis TaxID=1723361 RepID=UPI003D7F97E6